MSRFGALRILVLLQLVSLGACSAPPEKEMNGAQGAIEAARAAGAEQYASGNYRAAVSALERSRQVATERDYRLSLSLALDARERAIEAAKEAAQNKGSVRVEAERALAELTPALADAEAQLQAAQAVHGLEAQLADPAAVLASATKAMQEARAALDRDDYLAARDRLEGVVAQVHSVTDAIKTALAGAARQPRRRR